MLVPLNWLSEYVPLPHKVSQLTDRLTMIGHMLDKTLNNTGDTVIDLELRGNRSDMFGLIGVARDVAAAFSVPLTLPPTTPLPPIDPLCPLVHVEKNARDLVTRYLALRLAVKVKPSPTWLTQRLASLNIPSINNVVDITNFVLWETGQPMHAFDFNKLKGGNLILRQAKTGEHFLTIQQGQILTLNHEDLVICDNSDPQALTMIGGLNSKVDGDTTDILLESAVYNQVNCRRSSRRLKVFTDSSIRHEKLLDPNQVKFALERAIRLLIELADAQIIGQVSDYYPSPVSPRTIHLDIREIPKLTGIRLSPDQIETIFNLLAITVKRNSPETLSVTVPTFRTDIENSADLVEEIIRIYGYEKIPDMPLSGQLPVEMDYPEYKFTENLRDILLNLGLNEVITLPLIANDLAKNFASSKLILPINPPDPLIGTLRPSLLPGLTEYARRSINNRQPRVTIFEIGKTYQRRTNKFLEIPKLGILVAGNSGPKRWNFNPLPLTVFDLKGYIDKLNQIFTFKSQPDCLELQPGIFGTEIDISEWISRLPKPQNGFIITSKYQPIIEDINITSDIPYAKLEKQLFSLSSLIKQIDLIDRYGSKLTLRITYHSGKKQLSTEDVAPIRDKISKITVV